MESRGRRGPRPPVETEASEGPSIPLPDDLTPQAEPPVAGEFAAPPAADGPGARGGDSPTAFAGAGETPVRAPESPLESGAPAATDDRDRRDRDALAALAESQAALARGLAALGLEIAGLACSGFDVAARAAGGLFAVGTPSEAARLYADCLNSSLGAAWLGSARLADLGVAVAAETAEPLVAQLGRDWRRAG